MNKKTSPPERERGTRGIEPKLPSESQTPPDLSDDPLLRERAGPAPYSENQTFGTFVPGEVRPTTGPDGKEVLWSETPVVSADERERLARETEKKRGASDRAARETERLKRGPKTTGA